MVSSRLAALIGALFLLAACAPASQGAGRGSTTGSAPEPRAPKVMVASIFGVPPNLDQRFVVSSNNAGYVELGGLYSSKLTVYNDAGLLVPQLADTVPTLENGLWRTLPDNTMETRLTIRSGTVWHDGTPVTTRDILFSDEVYLDKELPQTILTPRTYVDRMVAVDDRTISVLWKQPYIQADAMFTPVMALPLPKHILERSLVEDKANFLDLPYWTTEFVGTGAFRLRELVRGSHLKLEANDHYVLGRPRIDVIEVRFIPDLNTLVANIVRSRSRTG